MILHKLEEVDVCHSDITAIRSFSPEKGWMGLTRSCGPKKGWLEDVLKKMDKNTARGPWNLFLDNLDFRLEGLDNS